MIELTQTEMLIAFVTTTASMTMIAYWIGRLEGRLSELSKQRREQNRHYTYQHRQQ